MHHASILRPDSRVFITEPREMVGASLVRAMTRVGLGKAVVATDDLQLADQASVDSFFAKGQPSHVFMTAGMKGGILANQRYPADLMFNNLRVIINVLGSALRHGTENLLYLGSACMYPRDCPQPMREGLLLTGLLELTNEPYSVSKLAGLKLCGAIHRQHGRRFIAAIPTNIFGPHDDFDPETAHVVGALMHRIHQAHQEGHGEVVVWGSGSPRREFLYCDDLADACLFLMEHYSGDEPINVGYGGDVSIRELAEAIKEVVGYQGIMRFDASKPDGAPCKSLDCSRLTKLGWQSSIPFREGLRRTYRWYVECGVKSSHGPR